MVVENDGLWPVIKYYYGRSRNNLPRQYNSLFISECRMLIEALELSTGWVLKRALVPKVKPTLLERHETGGCKIAHPVSRIQIQSGPGLSVDSEYPDTAILLTESRFVLWCEGPIYLLERIRSLATGRSRNRSCQWVQNFTFMKLGMEQNERFPRCGIQMERIWMDLTKLEW